MPRHRRKRPNWPYRLAWLAFCLAFVAYVALQTLMGAMTFAHRTYGIDWLLALVAALLNATIAVWFFSVGACIGSFLNVVAYRVPLGRLLGGHSSCPYCRVPIESLDNVPVLGWIKLRGRCRACRLPISPQYPLVELTAGVAFLVVYMSEFATGQANLPGGRSVGGGGLLPMEITAEVILRLVAYLFALGTLMAAALIAVKGRRVPLGLYVYGIVPLVIAGLLQPDVIVVSWRDTTPVGSLEARLDAVLTLICGSVTALALARLLAPVLWPGFDRRLIAGDRSTTQARQFFGSMAVAGSVVGWQSVVTFGWVLLLVSLVVPLAILWLSRRFRSAAQPNWIDRLSLADLTVWVWLALLALRAGWSDFLGLQALPSSIPEVARHVAGALLLVPLAWLVRKLFA